MVIETGAVEVVAVDRPDRAAIDENVSKFLTGFALRAMAARPSITLSVKTIHSVAYGENRG